MKTINDYDQLVCKAVQNNPLEFLDILYEEANKPENEKIQGLLRESACVIANLMNRIGISDENKIFNSLRGEK